MTPDDLAEMDAVERRFGELTLELRDQARRSVTRDATLFVEWMQANYAFHDVIYRVAELPLVERIAKSARRTFIGDRVWRARAELDQLYAKNDLQHRAIREAIGAGSPAAARTLAREHVLSSNTLIEVVLETLGASGRAPGWNGSGTWGNPWLPHEPPPPPRSGATRPVASRAAKPPSGRHGLAHPFGSPLCVSQGASTDTSRSEATSRRRVVVPSGRRTTSAETRVAPPSPKLARGSSEER